MEFKEIILDIIKNKEYQGSLANLKISSKELIPYHYYLTKCDIFRSCDLDLSANTFKVDEIKTIKLSNETRFINKLKLDYISITPPVYVGEKLFERPDNDAIISPMFYNPEDFSPYKTIKIWLTPEHGCDVTNAEVKAGLMSRFEDIIDNPNKYMCPTTHGILLRGEFETFSYPSLGDATSLNIEGR